ncbi:uncharacterized protein PHALS_11065 [Plasmopara halstedii]|uniref:Signal recognition particle, SRP9/SRP14 subunit n=1 Tax=Plasmopara halstedii TaxID=4781 RepID=A0A0P1AJA9_PLAHL|nr:uncharacterized protein PHALS_11065 [Plasmopara halstedii]CEG40887.1 hypothetical protein PHALS_11065 [Plasmopara halstedii]|eukprot:XP_024577256.1 hypothetical protein PHALS_11065 [Plasmopara halstedii]
MAPKGTVSWERFDEQTKLAFVGDPLNSRFFFKTRVTANDEVKVVARVSHHSTKSTPVASRTIKGRNETVKYATVDTTNFYRLTRLLRFVMQEILGPMVTLPAQTISDSRIEDAPASASHNDKKKTKKKKKAARK